MATTESSEVQVGGTYLYGRRDESSKRRVEVLKKDPRNLSSCSIKFLDPPYLEEQWTDATLLAPLPKDFPTSAPRERTKTTSQKRKRNMSPASGTSTPRGQRSRDGLGSVAGSISLAYGGGEPSASSNSVMAPGKRKNRNTNAVASTSAVAPTRQTRALIAAEAASQPEASPAPSENESVQESLVGSRDRNIEEVCFGDYRIRAWYRSPYPLSEGEISDEIPPTSALARNMKDSVKDTHSAILRPTHKWNRGRASDLLTGARAGQEQFHQRLYVCDKCLKYWTEGVVWEVHQGSCKQTNPPGTIVYSRDPTKIWEIDGEVKKLFCQNLSLFGKLFIHDKTLFFDLDNFMFYVLTVFKDGKDHIVGYFSKEKVSFDDYNLATIVTFPHWQRKSYGMLMIEFSYELSRRAGKIGTPERPLSALGLRGYLSYWIGTLVRFFRRVLSAVPSPTGQAFIINTSANFPDVIKDKFTIPAVPKSKKRIMNSANLKEDLASNVTPLDYLDDPLFTTHRAFHTHLRPDGGAETHVHVHCTLADIARATNLRVEDALFALGECGLLAKRISRARKRKRHWDRESSGRGKVARASTSASGNGDNGNNKVEGDQGRQDYQRQHHQLQQQQQYEQQQRQQQQQERQQQQQKKRRNSSSRTSSVAASVRSVTPSDRHLSRGPGGRFISGPSKHRGEKSTAARGSAVGLTARAVGGPSAAMAKRVGLVGPGVHGEKVPQARPRPQPQLREQEKQVHQVAQHRGQLGEQTQGQAIQQPSFRPVTAGRLLPEQQLQQRPQVKPRYPAPALNDQVRTHADAAGEVRALHEQQRGKFLTEAQKEKLDKQLRAALDLMNLLNKGDIPGQEAGPSHHRQAQQQTPHPQLQEHQRQSEPLPQPHQQQHQQQGESPGLSSSDNLFEQAASRSQGPRSSVAPDFSDSDEDANVRPNASANVKETHTQRHIIADSGVFAPYASSSRSNLNAIHRGLTQLQYQDVDAEGESDPDNDPSNYLPQLQPAESNVEFVVGHNQQVFAGPMTEESRVERGAEYHVPAPTPAPIPVHTPAPVPDPAPVEREDDIMDEDEDEEDEEGTGDDGSDDEVIITREMIEEVASARNVVRMALDLKCVVNVHPGPEERRMQDKLNQARVAATVAQQAARSASAVTSPKLASSVSAGALVHVQTNGGVGSGGNNSLSVGGFPVNAIPGLLQGPGGLTVAPGMMSRSASANSAPTQSSGGRTIVPSTRAMGVALNGYHYGPSSANGASSRERRPRRGSGTSSGVESMSMGGGQGGALMMGGGYAAGGMYIGGSAVHGVNGVADACAAGAYHDDQRAVMVPSNFVRANATANNTHTRQRSGGSRSGSGARVISDVVSPEGYVDGVPGTSVFVFSGGDTPMEDQEEWGTGEHHLA